MKTIFHAMEEKILQQFIETKKELLEIAATVSAKERAEGRKEIMEAATLFEVPEDLEDPRSLYSIDAGGNAIIPIRGKLTPEADVCDGFFSDCTTYGFIQTAALAADEDPNVTGKILFHVSSGGGHVSGVDACGQVIAGLNKPTEGVVFGMAASAAFWLASQMGTIRVSSPTDFVGSVGVAVEIVDMRKREEAAGIKRIVLTSTDAPDKRVDLATDEGQKKLVAELDAIHQIFASRLSSGRGVSVDKINADFGQGGLVIASQAKKAGMIDFIDNEIGTSNQITTKTPAVAGTKKEEANKMASLQDFLAQNPAAKTEYDADIKAHGKTEFAKGETAGTEATAKAWTQAAPILSSSEYPQSVKDRVVAKAEKGDSEGVADFVAMFDLTAEANKGKTAEEEQGEETNSDSSTLSASEKSEADFQARLDKKGGS